MRIDHSQRVRFQHDIYLFFDMCLKFFWIGIRTCGFIWVKIQNLNLIVSSPKPSTPLQKCAERQRPKVPILIATPIQTSNSPPQSVRHPLIRCCRKLFAWVPSPTWHTWRLTCIAWVRESFGVCVQCRMYVCACARVCVCVSVCCLSVSWMDLGFHFVIFASYSVFPHYFRCLLISVICDLVQHVNGKKEKK